MVAQDSSGVRSGIRKAVVPAAGLGTRLRPLTNAIPKELLPVGRLPVLAHIAAELIAAGITDVLFVVSEAKPQIHNLFRDLYSPGHDSPSLRCAYAVQREQRGLGDALLQAEGWVEEEPFLVAFGDCLIDSEQPGGSHAPICRLTQTFLDQKADAAVLVETVPWERVARYGVLAPEWPLEEGSRAPFAAADIVEKPHRDAAPSNRVVAARWVLSPALFEVLKRTPPDAKGELALTDAVRSMRREGGSLWAVPLHPDEARRDVGSYDSYYEAFVRYALRDPEYGRELGRKFGLTGT